MQMLISANWLSIGSGGLCDEPVVLNNNSISVKNCISTVEGNLRTVEHEVLSLLH